MPDVKSTGVYVKFVLVADKPFIRHVCGMLSHNATAFGAPFCQCNDCTELCAAARQHERREHRHQVDHADEPRHEESGQELDITLASFAFSII